MKPRYLFFIALTFAAVGAGAWFELSERAHQKTIKLKSTNFGGKSEQTEIKVPQFSDILEMGEEGLKTTQAKSLIGFLESASIHGLTSIDTSPFKTALDEGKRLDEAQKQKLKDASVKLAKDLSGGRVNWARARTDWDTRPNTSKIQENFNQALEIDALDEWVKSVTPKSDNYLAMIGARQKYAEAVKNGGFIAIGNIGGLKFGSIGENVGKLRTRLAQENYNAPVVQDPNYFDAGLKSKVELYQKAHGLKITGELNENTIAALNISAKERLAQIDLNLERERWLPHDNVKTRIEANIPNQHLVFYENGAPKMEMPVIVGKEQTKTPILTSSVHRVIFNPSWYKPPSIKGRQRVQPPGPRNSLGRVKFDFDNRHSVYLHDTPNHYLFSAARRTLSHGCVRLHYPKELAAELLGTQGYDMEKIQKITSTVRTTPVKLETQIPVYITYRTAFVDTSSNEGGIVHFATDVYEWDPITARLLDNDPNNDNSSDKQLAQQNVNVAAP